MKELKRILLVEDDENDIKLTLSALEENNLANRVDIARDGAQALEYLYRKGKFKNRPEGNPLVVFLDLKMPKVDGLEVLKQIKSEKNLRLIPVVVLTSSREEKDIVESYEFGVNAYVVKPVDFLRFVDCIKELGLFWALLNESP